MTSNNDGFRTVICHTQNLSLIKFHYLGIKIIILPFSYFRKDKKIEVHTEVQVVSDMIYHVQNFGFLSFHYLVLKTIIFTFY